MRRMLGLAAGGGLAVAALLGSASPGVAQTPPLSTITFKLTVNGTPPPRDSFVVNWAENGIELCPMPCAGGGRTYTKTMDWPKGPDPIHFRFARFSAPTSLNAFPTQIFALQTVTPAQPRTVSASFTYGTAGATTGIPVPPTGGAPQAPLGASLVVLGGASLWFAGRRRGWQAVAQA